MCDTFCNSFLLIQTRFRKALSSSLLSRLIKKGRPSIVPGLPFLVYVLNAALFRTPHLAMVSNGRKKQSDLYRFTHCLDCHLHIVELQSVLVVVLLLELDELLHQTLGDCLITLLSVEIVQLFRVGV